MQNLWEHLTTKDLRRAMVKTFGGGGGGIPIIKYLEVGWQIIYITSPDIMFLCYGKCIYLTRSISQDRIVL